MHPALLRLLWLLNRAAWRRALRGARTVRGAFLLLFTMGFIALMVVPSLISAILMSGRPETRFLVRSPEPFTAPALLGLCVWLALTSAGEKAIVFNPAEVDFLFPAPFARRELLIYKLGKTALGLVFLAGFVSLTALMYFPSWLAGFVGLLLALALLQLISMTAALLGQIVTESAYTRTRRVILALVLILVLLGLAQAVMAAPGRSLAGLATGFRGTWPGRVLLAPFVVFSQVIFAEAWYPDLLGWGAGALAIDLTLLAIILRLDANYLESSSAISQKVYEQARRMRQGGGLAMPAGARAGRIRLAQPPRLGGVGPVAWRQTLLALRTSRHALFASLAIAAIALAGSLSFPQGPGGAAVAPGMGIGMTIYLTFLFSMQLPWAFRGDLDHIDFLKTLPLHPFVLAVGELSGGTLLLTLIQLLLLALFTIPEPSAASTMLVVATFTVPFNATILALNNLLFLIYPVRMVAGTTFDFQAFGKMMLFFLLQFLGLLPLLGLPAGLGGLAWFLAGYSWPVFVVTAWLVLVAELVPLVMLVAWAFERFDPSTQTPAE